LKRLEGEASGALDEEGAAMLARLARRIREG
jgi:hypothetical protein